MPVSRPCLDCGELIGEGSRCLRCNSKYQSVIERRRYGKRDRSKYQGSYTRRAKLVRQSATHCWICGEGQRLDDPFQADHIFDTPDSPLAAAHRSCNASRGKPPKELDAVTPTGAN